jgi:signal transduction histidine kinase
MWRRLRKAADPDSFFVDKLTKVQGQGERASRIIDHLRTFGRPRAQHLSPFPISRPVRNVLDLLGQQFANRGIAVDIDLPEDLPLVLGDEAQLEQVVINLLNNARDALTDFECECAPTILVEARETRLQGEAWLCLDVIDNGPGMPAEVAQRVFEPFFTTKEVGKGTGLGLSISYGLIKAMGGKLFVRSEPGAGAVFSVFLRVAAQDSSQPPET